MAVLLLRDGGAGRELVHFEQMRTAPSGTEISAGLWLNRKRYRVSALLRTTASRPAGHGSSSSTGCTPAALQARRSRSDSRSGASSVAGSGPRSPWPLLGAFVVVLALLMLLAYLGGMAFSTIMDR